MQNPKLKFDPEEDELNVLRERYSKLKAENDALKKPRELPKRSSIFLIITAMLTLARLILYAVVEHWGAHADVFGLIVSAVFGFIGMCMIVGWAITDFEVELWITAGSAIFLIVQIIISISILDPALLENGWPPGPVQHALPAAAVLIASLLFAATRTFRLIMGALLLLVSNPFRRN